MTIKFIAPRELDQIAFINFNGYKILCSARQPMGNELPVMWTGLHMNGFDSNPALTLQNKDYFKHPFVGINKVLMS